MRAAQLMLAAAVISMACPPWVQTSASPRTPDPRDPQQSSSSSWRRPTTKPPPKPKAQPKKPRVKTPPPAGVVIRSGEIRKPLGPAFSEKANAQREITEALLRAKSDNRRVLILWGANWSSNSLRLNALFMSDPTLQRLFVYEYDLVLVDVGARGRNLDIALSYGVSPQASGVPWLTVLSSDAEPVCNLHADRFKDGRGEFDVDKLSEFLRGYQAMYPAADTLLNMALAEARNGGRKLLLQFSAPTCERCSPLEQWFARSDVDSILARNFVRLRIDVDRTVGGREVLRRFSKTWQTSIPWFAIITAKTGEVLATSDALDGRSIAELDSDEAIARFGEVLQANATTINVQEIEWLMKSLRQLNAPVHATVTAAKSKAASESGATPADAAEQSESPDDQLADADGGNEAP